MDTNTTPEATQGRIISKRAEKKGRRTIRETSKQLEKLEIEYVKIDSIRPNAYNPNRQSDHDFEMLLNSIETHGFTTPVLVNDDGTIIDGEHRWRAATVLGMKEVPIVRADMDVDQMRIATIQQNRARGSHDIQLEVEMFRDLEKLGAKDWVQEALQLSDVEFDKLLEDVPAPDILAGEEFTEAWEPQAGFTQEETDLIKQGSMTSDAQVRENADGSTVVIGMTPDAIEAQRKRAELIDRAKTEKERQQVRKESRVYRVSLVFSGEEAEVVKAVLGKKPAEMLVTLCRNELEEE